MSYTTVLPIWEALRQRFTHTTSALTESDLNLTLGKTSIRALLYHTAEVEYMFAEWFFGKTKPEYPAQASSDSIQQLVELLAASKAHFVAAMRELPEEDWGAPIESPMGVSSPLEAVGRLMYHTGMHAGQISLIQQNGSCE